MEKEWRPWIMCKITSKNVAGVREEQMQIVAEWERKPEKKGEKKKVLEYERTNNFKKTLKNLINANKRKAGIPK